MTSDHPETNEAKRKHNFALPAVKRGWVVVQMGRPWRIDGHLPGIHCSFVEDKMIPAVCKTWPRSYGEETDGSLVVVQETLEQSPGDEGILAIDELMNASVPLDFSTPLIVTRVLNYYRKYPTGSSMREGEES